MSRLEIHTEDLGEKWRVTYTLGKEGLGLIAIEVNKQDGEAAIARLEQ